ncbi:hypothetical protein EDD91_0059 [Streptomyces sp. KS 21]|nr:hypothetical protein EDD91_0059 [Streptomyces sp. KS 21]
MYYFETANRAAGIVPTFDMLMPLRRPAVGGPIMYPLIERTERLTVPEAVIASPQVQAMQQAATEILVCINDVHGVETQEACGDVHNIVLAIEHEQHCTRGEAVQAVCDLMPVCYDRFLRIEATLPDLFKALELSEGERRHAETYVRSLRSYLASSNFWSKDTERYILDALPVEVYGHPTALTDAFASSTRAATAPTPRAQDHPPDPPPTPHPLWDLRS